jgi:hypothetical protein
MAAAADVKRHVRSPTVPGGIVTFCRTLASAEAGFQRSPFLTAHLAQIVEQTPLIVVAPLPQQERTTQFTTQFPTKQAEARREDRRSP